MEAGEITLIIASNYLFLNFLIPVLVTRKHEKSYIEQGYEADT